MKFSKALRYTSGFLLIGIILSILVIYVERSTLNTYQRNLPYLSLGDNLKSRITKGHLWFVEAMEGDQSVNFENDVLNLFTSSAEILQGAYDGGETALGTFEESDDEDTKALLKQAKIDVDKLADAARDGWATRNAPQSTTDSTASTVVTTDTRDQRFDAAYDRSLSSLDRLITHVSRDVKSDSSYLNFLSWVSIALIVVTFIVIAVLLFNFQDKNDKLVTSSAARLNEESNRVERLTTFIEAVSSGNYSIELTSSGDSDNLTKTLVDMRDKLRDSAEEGQRRNWSTTGLAQIGEILRDMRGTSADLYDKIIQFVVKYTKSNQGGLFILNDDNENDRYLELVSAYAYERKKFIVKRVNPMEGLLGQAFLEGQRIYLLEVPEDYVNITSGLGSAVPNALLLIPMKVNDKIYGVIELASFHPYAEYEIALVEKLAESIASTISSVKINESTKILLEKTQQQAEEMRAQEEEMRQNMEELEATQEEMRRKETHIQKMLDDEKERNVFKESSSRKLAELTKNPDIQAGNWNAALEVLTASIADHLKISRCGIWTFDSTFNQLTCEKIYLRNGKVFESGQGLSGQDHGDYFAALRKERDIIASDVHSNPATKEFARHYLDALDVRSMVNIPFYNEGKVVGMISCSNEHTAVEWNDDQVNFVKNCADVLTVAYKSMKMGLLLTQLHNSQDTLQGIIDNIPRAIFWKDHELRFQGCNRIFSDIAGLRSPREIVGKTDSEMPWKAHAEAYAQDDRAVMKENKARLNIEEANTDNEGNESWVLTSKVPISDENGKVIAVLGMFEDITQRKRKEAETAKKLQELDQLKKLVERHGLAG